MNDGWMLNCEGSGGTENTYVCKNCYHDLSETQSVVCKHCLCWFHMKCVGLLKQSIDIVGSVMCMHHQLTNIRFVNQV